MTEHGTERRRVLRWAAMATGVGLAGCSGENDTADPNADEDEDEDDEADEPTATETDTTAAGDVSASFNFEFSDGSMIVTYASGEGIPAGELRLRSTGGTAALWSDVGSLASSEPVTTGEVVVLGEQTAGWGAVVEPGETVLVERVVDGDVVTTLAQERAPAPTGPADEIDLWTWGDVGAALADATEEYESVTGATVVIDQGRQRQQTDRFETAIASGSDVPAGSLVPETDAGSWIDTRGLQPLADRLTQAGFKQEFVDGAWQSYADSDGTTYAVPVSISPLGLYYRNDILDSYGIEITSVTDWDEMTAALRDLPSHRHFLNVPRNQPARLWRALFRQVGGQPFTEDGAVNINTRKSRSVVSLLNDLYTSGVVDVSPAFTTEWFQRLRDGDIVAVLAGSWIESILQSNLNQSAGNWRLKRPPEIREDDDRASCMGSTGFVVPSAATQAEADRAWDFAQQVLTDTDAMTTMHRGFGVFPAYTGVHDNRTITRRRDFFGGQPIGLTQTDILEQVPGYRVTAATPAVTRAVNDTVIAAVEGDSTPRSALREAARQVARETGRRIA